MNDELKAAKAKLRHSAGQGVSPLGLEQAKRRFLQTAMQIQDIGQSVANLESVSEIGKWTKQQPWQATGLSFVAGLTLGQMRKSDLVVLNCLFQLLALASSGGAQKKTAQDEGRS